MKVVKLNWDNNLDLSSKHLVIGHLKPSRMDEYMHTRVHGIAIETVDTTKEKNLHSYSFSNTYIDGEIIEISKEEARKLLIDEIDKCLDLLYK